MRLTAEQITDVALAILDEVGLDGLTTRRLALELGVRGPSLYHHFRSKHDLLGHMAAAMMSRRLGSLDRSVSWDNWLRALAHTTRRMILDHRDGARLLTAASPTATMQGELIPAAVQPLVEDGLDPVLAQRTIGLIASFVIGWTMNEQNATIRDFMRDVGDIEADFSFGIETIVRGVAALREERPIGQVHYLNPVGRMHP